jgi:DNA-binding GntR family transcriptional regulator
MIELENLKSSPSLKGSAFQALKNAIMRENLKTDAIYKIDELAKSFGSPKGNQALVRGFFDER